VLNNELFHCTKNACDQGGFSFCPYLAANIIATSDYYSIIFFNFGKLIGDRIGTINGASYMDYIVPGII